MTTDILGDDVSLKVSFDVDQLSNQLCWAFCEDSTGRNLFATTGRYAGAVHFKHAERVYLDVFVFARYGDPYWGLHSLKILSASVTTVPRRTGLPDHPFGPSPFTSEQATTVFDSFDGPVESHPTSHLVRYAFRSTGHFAVVQEKGLWEMSMTLTAQFQRKVTKDKPPKSGPMETRVIVFDPEAEVGMGT